MVDYVVWYRSLFPANHNVVARLPEPSDRPASTEISEITTSGSIVVGPPSALPGNLTNMGQNRQEKEPKIEASP